MKHCNTKMETMDGQTVTVLVTAYDEDLDCITMLTVEHYSDGSDDSVAVSMNVEDAKNLIVALQKAIRMVE